MALEEGLRKHLGDIVLFLVLFLALLGGTIGAILAPEGDFEEAIVYRDEERLLSLNLEEPSLSKVLSKDAQEVDPSPYGEEALKAYRIQGAMTPMTVALSEEGVAVLESGCPSQYCVGLGYTMDVRRPIVCAYNHVRVEFAKEEGALGSQSGPDIII